jgi:hypothetical protein
MSKTIVTHVAPDLDAIGSVWLLKRYGGLEDADVVFVNTGNPDKDVLNAATAVVDTGRVFDPRMLRFDHHQLPGKEANETCAALQIAQYLVLARTDVDFNSIWTLIDLIYAGDTGKRAADESRRRGIHALLSNKKRQGADNDALLAYGFELLDSLAQSLIAQDEALKSLVLHTVYRSEDGLVVALKDAPHGATFAAHEQGARLVVFANYDKNAIGVMRGGEGADVHCGGLIGGLLNDYDCGLDDISADLFGELCTWYRHQAGFFAGRGTDKAPSETPITVDLRDVAAAIDAAWKR